MSAQTPSRLDEALKNAQSYRRIALPQRSGFESDAIALADALEALRNENVELVRQNEGKQSRIDALMLEYCPEEMTPEQKAEWARHQVTVKFGCHCDIETMPEGFIPDGCVMDDNRDEHCVYAGPLRREGKTKLDCAYWRPIELAPKIAAAVAASPETPPADARITDLAILVRRLSRYAPPGQAAEALGYLKRHDLEGTPLRDDSAAAGE